MEKEYFLGKLKELKDNIKELKRQYEEENCRFKVGDKVRIDNQYGIIESISVINDMGGFGGLWTKIKKNGGLYSYSTNFYSFEYDSMELVKDEK